MASQSTRSAREYLAAVIGIWAALAGAWAAYVFLLPHQPSFAHEIGATGAFWVFLVLYSVPYYFLAAVLGVAIFAGSSGREGGA